MRQPTSLLRPICRRARSWTHTALTMGITACLSGCFTVPPTAATDASLPRIQLRGHWIHAEAHGQDADPTVIVLHGGPGADYRYLLGLKALASHHYRVVFYDQLGSGLSERVPPSAISVDSFIQDLDAVVSAYGKGQPVHLVGHSWGAMLASAYTGAHPERVASVVLAEPGFLSPDTLDGLPTGGWPGWRAVWGVSRAWVLKWWVNPQGDDYARDDWFLMAAMPAMQSAKELCDGRLPPLTGWRGGSPAFNATLGRMMDDPAWGKQLDFTQGLSAYKGKALFLRGSCNQVQGEAHQRRMMRAFPASAQAQLVTIDQAGHFMFNDQPDASVAAVRAFLDQH